jgi:hypothetical protein
MPTTRSGLVEMGPVRPRRWVASFRDISAAEFESQAAESCQMGVGRWAICVVVAGATLFAVGALFHLAQPRFVAVQFMNKALFRPWPGWAATYMALHPFGYGVLFATVYLLLLERGCVAPGGRDGLLYGLGVFLVGSLPVFLLAYASFNVSRTVIASWIIQNACQYLAAGLAVALVARRS